MKRMLFAALLLLLPVLVHAQALKLTWQDNSDNELGFALERCQGAGCANFQEIARVGPNVTEVIDAKGTAYSTTYCYRLRAFNNSNAGVEQFSDYTNEACGTTIDPPTLPPANPGGLEALPVTTSSVRLRWNAPDDSRVVAQQIEFNDHPQGRAERFRLLTAVLPDLREWTVAGLSKNSNYYFRMRRCIEADSLCSGYSDVAATKTPR